MTDTPNSSHTDHAESNSAANSEFDIAPTQTDPLDETYDEPALDEDFELSGRLPYPLRVLIGIGGAVLLLALGLMLTEEGPVTTATSDPDISLAPGSTLPPSVQPSTATTLPGASEPVFVDTVAPSIPNNVVWIDNFTTLDTDVWAVEHISSFGDGNNEEQCYLKDNTEVRDGKLVLTAREQTVGCENDTRQVTSGMVRSKGIEFKPGQGIEYRVKLTPADPNNQAGLWPALWASSFGGGGWPLGGEIDFFEVMTANNPKRVIYSIHFQNPSNQHRSVQKEIFLDKNFSDEWHTMRFDYGRGGELVWYLDGEEVQRVTDANTKQGYPTPFDSTIRQLRVNLALGGSPGDLDRRAVRGGATYEVDYIRIFDL